jgi:polar amino acid transport system substrate-binding protein
MHRHPLRLAALLLALALAFAACGDSGDGDDGTNAAGDDASTTTAKAADVGDLVKDGQLTVCSDIPYAPFEFEDGGELKGIDVDLMKGIAGQLGLKATFRDTDFDGIFASLAAGNCDVIASSVSITDERKKANDFTEGYFEINQSMLVRKGDETKYKDFASLKGKTIGVQSETTGAEFATTEAQKVGAQIKEFTGADELFTALKAKQIDAVVQDFPINSYNAETTGDTVVSATFDSNEAEQYGFVVPKDHPELLQAIDGALADLHQSGEYDKIIKQYLGDVSKP